MQLEMFESALASVAILALPTLPSLPSLSVGDATNIQIADHFPLHSFREIWVFLEGHQARSVKTSVAARLPRGGR